MDQETKETNPELEVENTTEPSVPPIFEEKLDSSDIDDYVPVIKPAPDQQKPTVQINQPVIPALANNNVQVDQPVVNPVSAPVENPTPVPSPIPETPAVATPQVAEPAKVEIPVTAQTPQPEVKPSTPVENKTTQVVTAQVPKTEKNQIHRSEKAKQMVNASKNKTKLIIIITVVVIAMFFGYKFIVKTGGLQAIINSATKKDNFKIDTGKDWADAYGTYIKDYFEDLEITAIDVAFVDFEEDGTPEMCIRYEDKNGNFPVKMFQINNNEVTETKLFFNSQFKFVYSSYTEDIKWYIYIASNKYGAYTEVSKILAGKAKDSDIKATNEKELTEFNKYYLASDYKVTYYECKAHKYLEDFQVAVDRYPDYNKNAKDAKDKLADDTANWKQEHGGGPVKTKIIVAEKVLNFGTYIAKVKTMELGQEKIIEKRIILKENFLTVDGKDVKYTAYPSFVTVEDGTSFEVINDNKFKYGTDGAIYKLEE